MRLARIVWLATALIVVSALAFSGCLSSGNPEQRTATLVVDFSGPLGGINPGNTTTWAHDGDEWIADTETGDGRTVWIFSNVTSVSTVLDLLEAAATIGGFSIETRSYVGMGTFVESIGGVWNELPGRGWQYDVNGEYATIACDRYTLADGDVITWIFADMPW